MRIFLSAGEPSGDLHGSSFIHSMRQLDSSVTFEGYGGDRMAQAGCNLLFPLCDHAVMGLTRVLGALPTFMGLLRRSNSWFNRERPDALVLIDYPGFNWWLARRAKLHRIPVFYFVPPQIWAWATWRVNKMRRYVDHVLCSLPFEETWYRERGVDAHYVGHPYFDAMAKLQLHREFIDQQQARGGRVIALLPGSRNQEVEANFPTMVRAAQRLHHQHPDVRFLAACFKEEHRAWASQQLKGYPLPLELHVGRTPEIISLAHSCLAVSGSVSLELLYHAKPTVIVYRAGSSLGLYITQKYLLAARFITLVNLLADKELYPEFLSDHCEAEGIAKQLDQWLTNPEGHRSLSNELQVLKVRVAQPGACHVAAEYVLRTLRGNGWKQHAA
jgi:lipid-A-disaccharide synthase